MQESTERLYIKDNVIDFTQGRLYSDLRLIKANPPYFCLRVVNGDMKEKEYYFYTLEEAIYFKHKLAKCKTLEDVQSLYDKLVIIDSAAPNSPVKIEDNKAFLTEKEIKNAIINYYGSRRDRRVTVNRRLTYKNGQLDIKFYKTEYFDFNGIQQTKIKRTLTYDDLKAVFDDLLKYESYELVDFKYVGGVHNPGYAFSNYTPHFDGIQLYVKEREKPMRLDLNKRFIPNE